MGTYLLIFVWGYKLIQNPVLIFIYFWSQSFTADLLLGSFACSNSVQVNHLKTRQLKCDCNFNTNRTFYVAQCLKCNPGHSQQLSIQSGINRWLCCAIWMPCAEQCKNSVNMIVNWPRGIMDTVQSDVSAVCKVLQKNAMEKLGPLRHVLL